MTDSIRTRSLAHRLAGLYGYKISPDMVASPIRPIPVNYWRNAMSYKFNCYEQFLFGPYSFNDFIKNVNGGINALREMDPCLLEKLSFLKTVNTLEFETLDELDVLLTLAGANSVSETEAV